MDSMAEDHDQPSKPSSSGRLLSVSTSKTTIESSTFQNDDHFQLTESEASLLSHDLEIRLAKWTDVWMGRSKTAMEQAKMADRSEEQAKSLIEKDLPNLLNEAASNVSRQLEFLTKASDTLECISGLADVFPTNEESKPLVSQFGRLCNLEAETARNCAHEATNIASSSYRTLASQKNVSETKDGKSKSKSTSDSPLNQEGMVEKVQADRKEAEVTSGDWTKSVPESDLVFAMDELKESDVEKYF